MQSGHKCLVAFIHNNETSRNHYALPRLENLSIKIGALLTLVSWQPPLKPHSYWIAFVRECRYLQLELGWARYRCMPRSMSVKIFRSFLLHKVAKYLVRKTKRAAWRKRSFIETVVTAKHILAWQMFLESDSHYLICSEDDIVFCDDSIDRISRFIEIEGNNFLNSELYVDLAGGLSEQQLQINSLVEKRSADQTRYKRPTTNTACSYLLSRKLAEAFIAQILAKPSLRLIGIDWMINAMFMANRTVDPPCQCIHFSPPVFRHGTFSGDYVSWQKKPGLH